MNRYFSFVCTALYVAAIATGLKRFILWTQITDVFGSTASWDVVTQQISAGTAHATRITLMFPCVYLADSLNLDRDLVFSFFVLACLICTILVIKSAAWRLGIRSGFGLVDLMVFGASVFMNGRVAIAILGNAVVLQSFVRRLYFPQISAAQFLFRLSVGLFLTSVTSGAFFVCISAILLFHLGLVVIHRDAVARFFTPLRLIVSLILLVALIFSIWPIVEMFLMKNLEFNRNFEGLLRHGFMRNVDSDIWIAVPLLGSALFIIAMLLLNGVRSDFRRVAPFSMLLPAVVIGVLGESSFFSGLSSMVLYLLISLQSSAAVADSPGFAGKRAWGQGFA